MYTPRVAITVGSEASAAGYQNYVRSIAEADGEPVLAAPDCDVEALLDSVDALLLTGGTDVDPSRFGEAPVPELMTPDPPRDESEIRLVLAALRRDLPVLAICRGHQVLNVALGGRLQQHIPGDGHRAHAEPPHDSRCHAVSVEEGSVLADLLGPGAHEVNSRHHQAVRMEMLGEGLLPSAMSPDGCVEALESPEHRFVLGVQWHPERPEIIDRSRSLFAALIAAAREARAVTS
jgi:putative glutamine amidotransferase